MKTFKRQFNELTAALRTGLVAGIVVMMTSALPAQTAPATGTPENAGAAGGTRIEGKATAFLKEAAKGNALEIRLAELAEQKSQSPAIRQLAQTILKDHQQANKDLVAVAQKCGVDVEAKPGLKADWQEHRLRHLSGARFDMSYAEYMLRDHQQDLARFEKAATQIQETGVRQYAQNMLPRLREHLKLAEQAARAVGVESTTISSILGKAGEAQGGTGDEGQSSTGTQNGR